MTQKGRPLFPNREVPLARRAVWDHMVSHQPWDIIIVGAGITGAGIFREAVSLGLKVLLLEQRDFAWGASSRSGKMVHGGLRYLRQGEVFLTWESARERENLLREARGLVEPLGFLFPVYRVRDRLLLALGLRFYDLCCGRRSHRYLPADEFRLHAPHVNQQGLRGGFRYREANTDDARLVLRLIWEGRREGGCALNYARVLTLLRNTTARVTGVAVQDEISGETAEITAGAVINATGAWSDRLRQDLGREPRMRPLRGIHLLFPHWRFPLAQAIGFFHPGDGRPLYALPWAGATLVGTTDVDHEQDLDRDPAPTREEVEYLFSALHRAFPTLDLRYEDVVATFAGVRPVVRHGKSRPSQEPREHVLWYEDGLLTVTGGKLTTFRILARQALRFLRSQLGLRVEGSRVRLFSSPSVSCPEGMDKATWLWLLGRYGADAVCMVSRIPSRLWKPMAYTPFHWGEILWALQHEMVVHLDDLLLRRVRVGLLLLDGGLSLLPQIEGWCQQWLGWDSVRWRAEVDRYSLLLQGAYRLAEGTPHAT